MRFLLSPLLSFHWMVVFALLAVLASGPHGLDRIVSMIGFSELAEPAFGRSLSAVFAVIFALVAVLFLWSLLTTDQDDRFTRPADDVAMLAFAAAIAATTALLVAVAVLPAGGLFEAVTLQIGGLGASYAAIHAERRSLSLVVDDGGENRSAARLMAVGAAHASMLTRLSGRGTGAGN